MFCSNCGNKLADGAKFCSFCGNRVQAEAEQEFRFSEMLFEEPKHDAGTVPEKDTEFRPSSSKASISFDWSNVVEEPHKKETTNVKSPWASSGGIDEKELYAEMTPSTDRSRTMSFIDVLKAEKEEKERKADERAFVYTDVLELDPDMSSFVDPPQMHYAPLYEDVDEPVRTPFDDIDKKPEIQKPEDKEEPAVSVSRETIAQFDEYVKSFEANIAKDEPRFEEPLKPAEDEPRFELPDFLTRPTEPVKAEPAAEPEPEFELPEFKEPVFEQPKYEEPAFEQPKYEEPVFELPKYEEPEYEEPEYEEPVFEEPKYEEPKFEFKDIETGVEHDDHTDAPAGDESMEDMYLDLDTSKATIEVGRVAGRSGRSGRYETDEPEFPEEEEPVDEKELFDEMRRAKPEVGGMTIAPPADKESEIEALRQRLAELTGAEKAPEPAAEATAPVEIIREPVTAPDTDKYIEGFSSAGEAKTEAADEAPVLLVLDDVVTETAAAEAVKDEPAVSEGTIPEAIMIEEVRPEPVVLEEVRPEPVVFVEPEPEPVVLEEVRPEPVVLVEPEPEPVVIEEVRPEPAVIETVRPEPALVEAVRPEPVVSEAVRPEPAAERIPAQAAVRPEKAKPSDALSLEELEKDLFGEDLSAEAEVEETKKIDKFYTLYRKNEEFQRLLDEEYDKLKGEASEPAVKPAENQTAAAAPAAEVPAENSKAYRQIEDETIYKAFEIPPELVKAPPKEVSAAEAQEQGRRPVEVVPAGTVPAAAENSTELTKADRKAEAKAAKALAKAEKKAAKAKAREEAAEVEYEEVDTGSRFLTVLAVVIAVILVLLLAVILVLQVAPDSGIAITIDSIIERITGGVSAVYPDDGRFLL